MKAEMSLHRAAYNLLLIMSVRNRALVGVGRRLISLIWPYKILKIGLREHAQFATDIVIDFYRIRTAD
jgi:hypothetical protein